MDILLTKKCINTSLEEVTHESIDKGKESLKIKHGVEKRMENARLPEHVHPRIHRSNRRWFE